jgi:hypothetical protein
VTVLSRVCPVCSFLLAGHRDDASYCSTMPAERAWRLRRLLQDAPQGATRAWPTDIRAYGRARRSSRHKRPERPPNGQGHALLCSEVALAP